MQWPRHWLDSDSTGILTSDVKFPGIECWHGACVRLVFERGGRVEMAIEIKRSTSPALSRGFGSAQALLKPKESYLAHRGVDTWPVEGNVMAISLTDLMRRLAESAG